MNLVKYIKSIKRDAVCCVLLFTLFPYCHAAQGVIEEASPQGENLQEFRPLIECDGNLPDSLKIEPYRTPEFANEATDSTKEKNILIPGLPEKTKRPLLALKTNLLFDVALMPNVEIEVPIGRRWSVHGEYMFPWWLLKDNRYCLEILSGGVEGRYWLGNLRGGKRREVLTGHFAGLYAGGGKYDLQWKENGYQGEFFIAAGISYGWATRIARNLHLEFSLGIGLLHTDYRHYHARDNYHTLLWQENGNYTWFGPTKAKISLVWLLNRKVKKGGGR